MGIQLYGFIHNLILLIEKFNNYRVTKYSNDTKLGTFLKYLFILYSNLIILDMNIILLYTWIII